MALPDKRLRQKTSASASATDTKGGTREKVEKMKPAKPITKVRKNLKADEAKAKTKKKQEKAGMKEKKDKKEKKADKEKPDKKEKNAEKVKKDKKDNNAEKEKPDKKEKNAEKEKPDKKEKKAEKEKPDKKEKNTEKEKKDKKEKSAEQETQERKKAEEIKGKIETTAAKRKSQDHEVKESKKPKAAPATKEEKKAQKKEQKKAEKKEKKESKRADKAAKIDEAKETKDEAETPKRPPAIRYVPVEKKKIKPIFETPVPSPSASTGGTSAGTARTPTSTAMERANDKLKELTSMLESSQSPSEPDDAEMMFGAMIAEQKEEREKEAEENGETSDTTGEEEEDDDDDDKEDKVAEEEEDEEPSQEMSDDEYDGEEMTGEELEGLLAQSPVYDPETDEDEEEEEEEEESEDQDDQEEDEEEAEDETKVQDKEDDKDKHALVPVTQATAFGTKLLRNSTTNKREYDTFVRQIKSSGKFPTQLSEFAQTNRLELFNIWMNTGCSWDSCCLEVERLQTTKNQTIRGWRAVQGKELRPKYTEDKFNKLISARRDAGLFYEDQDFPGDIDECWYFMRVGEEIKNKSETADRLKLAASKQVDDTLRQSLTDQDEGILRPGALPKIEGVSASASKALASSFGQVAAPKKKPKEKAEKVEATSAKGEAVQRMETLLKDSAAARTSSITLQSVEYAAELSRQLLQHAEALEGFYQRVKLAVEKDEDESFFKSLMVKIKEKEAFGVKAQAAASAMLRSAKAKAKAKAKPKGRKSKNATAKPADDEK